MSITESTSYATDVVTPTYLGDTIRQLRKAANLTQTELAEKARVSRCWISQLETGKRTAEIGKTMVVLHCLEHKLAVLPLGTVGEIVETTPSGIPK